jgi:hypothetical protein
MRRDPDLLRDIMLAAEDQPAGQKLFGSSLKSCCFNPYELGDHVQQLIEAGYLDGVVHFHGKEIPPKIVIDRIKTAGHDFLQAMREDTVWKHVKSKVMVPTASWTLGLAVEYAKHFVAEKLGLP